MRMIHSTKWYALWATVLLVWVSLIGAVAAGESTSGEMTDGITMEEAFALALEGSPKIRAALLELEDARIGYEQVRSTSLMRPDPAALLQAESAVDLAERNLALVQNAVRLEVAESFLGVLRVQNLMEVVEGSLALAKRQQAIAESRYAVGSAARVETIRAANQVSSTQATLLELEGQRELALMALRMGIGLPLDDPVVPVDFEVEPLAMDIDLEEDLRFAMEHRLEILRAQSGVEIASKHVELASNDYTPAIALARAKIALQQAQEGLSQAKNGIELEIRQVYQTLLDSERRLKVLEQSIEEAEETLEITQEMYDAGVATDVEVLGAQTALAQAQTDYVNTLFDLRTAQVRYLHATARAFAQTGGGDQ